MSIRRYFYYKTTHIIHTDTNMGGPLEINLAATVVAFSYVQKQLWIYIKSGRTCHVFIVFAWCFLTLEQEQSGNIM